jgi:hypothetical protein
LFVAATEPPDGGGVALVQAGHVLDATAVGHGQDDARPLDGEERKDAAVRHLEQEDAVGRSEGERTRFTAAHGSNLRLAARLAPMITTSSISCRTREQRH